MPWWWDREKWRSERGPRENRWSGRASLRWWHFNWPRNNIQKVCPKNSLGRKSSGTMAYWWGKEKMNREEKTNLWSFHSRSEPHMHREDTLLFLSANPTVCPRNLAFPLGSPSGTQCDLVNDTVTASSLLSFVKLGTWWTSIGGREEGFCQNSPKQSMQTVPEAPLVASQGFMVCVQTAGSWPLPADPPSSSGNKATFPESAVPEK